MDPTISSIVNYGRDSALNPTTESSLSSSPSSTSTQAAATIPTPTPMDVDMGRARTRATATSMPTPISTTSWSGQQTGSAIPQHPQSLPSSELSPPPSPSPALMWPTVSDVDKRPLYIGRSVLKSSYRGENNPDFVSLQNDTNVPSYGYGMPRTVRPELENTPRGEDFPGDPTRGSHGSGFREGGGGEEAFRRA